MPGILNISNAASLGLHGMAVLAQTLVGTASAREIASRLKVSEAHLAKVFQRLAKTGLLESRRGPGGGFRLGRSPKEISLLDIYQALDGPLPDEPCLFNKPVCCGKSCLFGSLLRQGHQLVTMHLANTNLSDLAELSRSATDAEKRDHQD